MLTLTASSQPLTVSDLAWPHRLPSTVDTFNPTNDAILWFDAGVTIFSDAGTTPVGVGQRIEQWNSRNGTNVLFQSDFNSRPLWGDTTGPNSTPVAQIATTTGVSTHLTNLYPINYSQPITISSVVGVSFAISETTNTIVNGGGFTLVMAKTNTIVLDAGTTLTSPANYFTNWVVLTVGISNAQSFIRTNGVYLTNTGTAGSGSFVALMIGTNLSLLENFYLPEMLIYNRILTSNQINQVENYLTNKYAL